MFEADFEKLGVFYLGREYNLAQKRTTSELTLYDSRDLLTHAVCIGMTGSGKTGLCLSMIEEAAIDNIPVIAIDPKGDLGNLLLTFPQLRPEDFKPWIDPDQARRDGKSVDELAASEADKWKSGLQEWDESGERIARMKQASEFVIYTPGSTAGVPISILHSFAVPANEVLEDSEALSERIASTTSSVLTLLAIDADPLRSKEYILLSNIIKACWTAKQELTLLSLIQLIQKPPLKQIGALDLDAFIKPDDRFELAMKLNNLLASPGFDTWLQGEPLDIDRMLFTAEGKPKVSVYSIAHLDDHQRMFAVTMLLNQVLSWMRAQSGTSSLRAMLYMDEIFGYFPPTANPPSKQPLLRLMKQARAFGLGVVLATQNPVDIDYKGLSNAGTWFIGRLQTERDKLRVLDGLEGAAGEAGSKFDRASMDKVLSQLGSRIFLMNNVHQDGPTIFETRWTLSYLRGPLTKDQIKQLTRSRTTSGEPAAPPAAKAVTATAAASGSSKPILPPDVQEFYLPIRQAQPAGNNVFYRPRVYAVGNVHFTDTKSSVDTTLQYNVLVASPGQAAGSIDWNTAQPAKVWMEQLTSDPVPSARFEPLPSGFSDAQNYKKWNKEFATWLYAAKQLKLFKSEVMDQFSKPRESERDFRVRLTQIAREQRDTAKAALEAKYTPKFTALQERLRRAQQQLEKQQAQARDQQMQTAIAVGATVFGALMSRRRVSTSTIGRAATAARSAGRATREQQDVDHAGESLDAVQQQLSDLQAQFSQEVSSLEQRFDPLQTPLTEVQISPKKTNVSVALVALVWAPFAAAADGSEVPLWMSTAGV